ncbi:MAG: 50S ribosomal protein L32 [Candidatus Omnitrophica bacterium]|nr:50S ribosomal protein L32 [Candidatus Omnitrophota bacterium]MCK5260364.1 50S ribosomal protein L32 [Candidatus Omnitrophota bacterium]
MAHPKRQHSRQRQRKRRTHQGAAVPNFAACSQCQKPIIPHRVCPFCGYYKGQPIVEIKTKETAGKE